MGCGAVQPSTCHPPPITFHVMKRIGFRGRLFLILLFFALVPSVVLTAAWAASWLVLPLANTAAAWDNAAATGAQALSVARSGKLSKADSAAVYDHEQALKVGQLRSKQAGYLMRRGAEVGAALSLIAFG